MQYDLVLHLLKNCSVSKVFTLFATPKTTTMYSSRVHDVLMQFVERSTDREYKIMRYSSKREVESDEEEMLEALYLILSTFLPDLKQL